MATRHSSLFAPSRDVARAIMSEQPTIIYETSEMGRIRDHLTRSCGLTDDQVSEARDGYNIIQSAKRQLGL